MNLIIMTEAIDWGVIGTQVILYIVGALLSVLSGLAIYWVNKKVKNEKVKDILLGACGIVSDGVDFVYQTYVQGLKGTDFWDEDAMKEANAKAVEYITKNLSKEAIDYIKANGKDVSEWAKEQIEIAIKKSKDNVKTK